MINSKLLELLCNTNGISGDEGAVRNVIIQEIKDYATTLEIDNMGNVLVFKKGEKQSKTKLLLSAHMDEVGFIVSEITSDGLLKTDKVGGIDNSVISATPVTVGKNNVKGVFGIKPIHLSTGTEKDNIPKLSNMYVDIGAKNREDALQYVKEGDSVAFVNDYTETEASIISKALDDRLGCLVLIDLIKSNLEYDMYFSFVVQEEVGLRGARVASYTINPQSAIVIEATTAADIHGSDDEHKVCCLNEGAVLSIMDRSTIYDKDYVDFAYKLAKDNNIPVQYKKAVAGGNDAGAIHMSRSGVRTLGVSVPCRYLHSAVSLINKADLFSVCAIVKETAIAICAGNI